MIRRVCFILLSLASVIFGGSSNVDAAFMNYKRHKVVAFDAPVAAILSEILPNNVTLNYIDINPEQEHISAGSLKAELRDVTMVVMVANHVNTELRDYLVKNKIKVVNLLELDLMKDIVNSTANGLLFDKSKQGDVDVDMPRILSKNIWLSVSNMIIATYSLCTDIEQMYGKESNTVNTKCSSLKASLHNLDKKIKREFFSCRRHIVSFDRGIGYFADNYRLNYVGPIVNDAMNQDYLLSIREILKTSKLSKRTVCVVANKEVDNPKYGALLSEISSSNGSVDMISLQADGKDVDWTKGLEGYENFMNAISSKMVRCACTMSSAKKKNGVEINIVAPKV
ncbi:zinc ABC transporter substrate-binding protein [Rickettsiales bacterium]|nr:zinc ABC transporter substrate-binding protein [Rickettsiales bacterium]